MAKLTADEKTKLNQLTAEMKSFYVTLRKADSLTKMELRRVTTKAWHLTMGFHSTFTDRTIRFRPEVPAETQNLFFALNKLNSKICVTTKW